jgi:hypothetical protein
MTRWREHNEGGFVVVWVALIITVLLGIAGFAVDLGNWYLNIQRTQRAADAAALAGDAYMPAYYTTPDSAGNTARQIAYETLLRNHVPKEDADRALASEDCATEYCIAGVEDKPTQLQVKVQVTVTNRFLPILGVGEMNSFQRDAIADHSPGLHITSFSNVLGGPEPDDGSGRWGPLTTANTNYWLQMGGRYTSKVEGDRFNSRNCDANPGPYNNPDVCSGGINSEFDAANDGYLFLIDIKPTPLMTGTAYLDLQAYDAQMTVEYSAAACPDGTYTSPTCPGDDKYGRTTTAGLADLRFNYYPDANDRTALTNCTRFQPRAGPVTPSWESVCPNRVAVDMSRSTRLYVRAYTSTEYGTNHFMLRAGLFASATGGTVNVAASQAAVQLSGDQHMPINNQIDSYVAQGRPFSSFSIAQIYSEWAGRTIHLQFWDLGDAQTRDGQDSGGSLFLNGSPTVRAALNNNCEYTVPGNNYNENNFSPALNPTAVAGSTSCGFPVTRQEFNGKLVKLNWNVPDSYQCEPPADCKLMVQMDMNGIVTDDTTTSVREPGEPIHLIN